ncbi:MAG: PASTA domain-containing protein, partial [Deltaproteobacteria bacterium]|nr:PASTA domain-containing protein [Deltaproteobacteria bacterium]
EMKVFQMLPPEARDWALGNEIPLPPDDPFSLYPTGLPPYAVASPAITATRPLTVTPAITGTVLVPPASPLTPTSPKEKVAVPNVVGLSEDKALKAIQQAGLRNFLYDVNYQGHDVLPDSALVKVCVGCVLSVTPSPGEMVELGTEVRMAVRKD